MRDLSLHHLVAPEASAGELVRIAANLDCRHVCLFTQDPNAGVPFPVLSAGELPDLRSAMQDSGVSLFGVASFPLPPQVEVSDYAAALERGAKLGGSRANARILDPDEARATANFGRFAELAASFGILASIEFMGFGATDALPQAVRIVRAAGRGGIAVDALHVVRTRASLAALRALSPDMIGYVQLCDGPLNATADDYRREGAFDRLAPGEGEFPLRDIVALTPADLPFSLEVPTQRWRLMGVDAGERARRVVDATRRLLAVLEA